MSALFSRLIPADALPQRLAGSALVLIALVLVAFDAAGISLTPNACSVLLLAALAIIAFAIHKTPNGITSLIGLFFLGTILWVAPRPLFALVTQSDSIYTLFFGQLVEPRGPDLYRLLAFWTIGIAGIFGGYFLSFSNTRLCLTPLSDRDKIFCKRSFTVAFIIVAVLLPVVAKSRIEAVASGGYAAQYVSQATYSFRFTRLTDILTPLLYALAVIIDEKRFTRMMVAVIVLGALICTLLGQRMAFGTWLLVALWHYSTILHKPIRMGRLFVALAAVSCVFQWIQTIRAGDLIAGSSGNPLLLQFLISQGITFMVPALLWQLSPPPLHSILGSILPMGSLYNFLGIGSAGTFSIALYVSSQGNPDLFDAGCGVGSSAFIDIFYACGQVTAFYLLACVLLGFLLRKWEERASHSKVALLFLCACLPYLFSLQRSTIATITSQIINLSVFMVLMYLLNICLTVCQFSEVPAEGVHGAN